MKKHIYIYQHLRLREGVLDLGFITKDTKIQTRKLFSVLVLVSGSLAWSFFALYSFENFFAQFESNPFFVSVGYALFLGFGALSAVIGGLIGGKVERRTLLLWWTTLGVIASASAAIFSGTMFLVSSVLLGISLGLGYPSFTSFLADNTVVEERARVSGLIILATFMLVIFAVGIVEVLGLGLVGVVLVSIVLRSANYFALILDPCRKPEGKDKSWGEVLASKNFMFYIFPWLMFNIATGLIPFVFLGLSSEYNDAITLGNILHYLGAGAGGFVGGFIADRVGRKWPDVTGMAMLGASFALLGLATRPETVLAYLAISGIAWGFLIVIYLAVPGDLSPIGSREKFYALGIVVPLIIYAGLGAATELLSISAPASFASSILSIIIFMSIIPVLLAEETLPETKIAERKLVDHVKKVSKLVSQSKD
jgi:MFS family permease